MNSLFFKFLGVLQLFYSMSNLVRSITNGDLKLLNAVAIYIILLVLNLLSVLLFHKYKSKVLCLVMIALDLPLLFIAVNIWHHVIDPGLAGSLILLNSGVILLFLQSFLNPSRNTAHNPLS